MVGTQQEGYIFKNELLIVCHPILHSISMLEIQAINNSEFIRKLN